MTGCKFHLYSTPRRARPPMCSAAGRQGSFTHKGRGLLNTKWGRGDQAPLPAAGTVISVQLSAAQRTASEIKNKTKPNQGEGDETRRGKAAVGTCELKSVWLTYL